jgi:signal transduction histidine kinase
MMSALAARSPERMLRRAALRSRPGARATLREEDAVPTPEPVDFRTVFEQAPGRSLVLRADAPRFTVVAASDAWLHAAGRSRDEVVGRGVLELDAPDGTSADPDDAGRLSASLTRVVRQQVPDALTGGGPGAPRWRAVSAPVRDADGAVGWIVLRREDVDAPHSAAAPGPPPERATAERPPDQEFLAGRLRELALELTRSEQLERRRLAAVLDGGLQPLLFATKMHLSLLSGEGLSEPAAGAADHARELLDEAVGVTRTLTVALSPPVLATAGLAPALEWLVERVQRQHRVTVTARLDADAAPTGWPAAEAVFDAARELLFNAVKYAGTDAVALALDRADGVVRVVVSDEGVGFDPAVIHPGVATAGQFGLYALQQRLRNLGGSVEVDSAPGRGTRVTLRLPLEPDGVDAATELSAAHRRREPAADAIRVVVADDHRIVREGLIQLLALEDDIAVVGEADNGEAALERVRELAPDVVLMDVSMPVMDGIEATRRLARSAPETAVIGLSMHTEGDLGGEMRRSGAVAHVPKGGPPDVLLEAIRRFGRRAARS